MSVTPILRLVKGSELTWQEEDNNFSQLAIACNNNESAIVSAVNNAAFNIAVQVHLSNAKTVLANNDEFFILDSTNNFAVSRISGQDLRAAIGAGTGTVSSTSIANANGFTGSVANPTSTPAFTINTTVTGMVKGNGTGILAATPGTDYLAPPSGSAMLKANSGGALANASATTDYVAPSAYASANGLTINTARLLGRTTAANGHAEEISIGSGLTLSAGVLSSSAGGGTVTTLSVASANGFTGSVANPSTTPTITIGTSVNAMLKGNGTAISAAVAGTDYLVPPSGSAMLKANSGGALANAVAGTDYIFPGGAMTGTTIFPGGITNLATSGLTLKARPGSSFDFLLINAAGAQAMAMAVGTGDISFFGKITAANGLATFNGASPTVSDAVGSVFITRDTTGLSGGSSAFVNSALKIYTKTGYSETALEWGTLSVLDNYAGAGENVAVYGQANKYYSGPTWGATFEVKDYTNSNVGAIYGIEVDVWANGAGANNRFGIGFNFGNALGGVKPTIDVGIDFSPNAGNRGAAQLGTGLRFLIDASIANLAVGNGATSPTIIDVTASGAIGQLISLSSGTGPFYGGSATPTIVGAKIPVKIDGGQYYIVLSSN